MIIMNTQNKNVCAFSNVTGLDVASLVGYLF